MSEFENNCSKCKFLKRHILNVILYLYFIVTKFNQKDKNNDFIYYHEKDKHF